MPLLPTNRLFSRSSVDKKYDFTVPVSTTVLELKNKIATEADVPAESQRLIYSGRVLKDQDTLEHYKIKSGHTIHLVKSASARAATASTNTNVPTNTTSTPSATASNNTGLPANLASGQGAFNPLAGLTDARYAGYGPALPSESMFGPDGGMQLPNEEDLDRMLDNPMVQQGMNEMLRNPQMMDYLINQNPQLRQMGPQFREMLQNDYFRQMLTNPQMIRQARQMQRMMGGGNAPANPNAMPAPGSMNDDDDNTTADSATAANNSTANATANASAANPFSALFGAGGVNPFGFPMPAGTEGAGASATAGGFPQFNPAMLQSLLANSGATAQPEDTRPPEIRFESQLRQLNDMGFFDFDANVRALRRSGGSVQGAIEHLLSG